MLTQRRGETLAVTWRGGWTLQLGPLRVTSQRPGPGRRQLWKSWSQNDTDARAGVSAIGA